MELRLLVTFEKVAGVLSFTRAAADLRYAQSSVTSQIRTLESSLGVELFERLGSRIRLTEPGERLLPYARRIIELSEEARAAVVETEEPAGTIAVGTMESLTSYRLPPLLELFHHRYPKVRLALRPTLGDETRQALRQGTYDIGFLMEPETEHAGLESEVLAEEPLVLVASPRHPLAGRTDLTSADLAAAQLVGTEPGCPYRDLFERELRDWAPPFMEFGTIEATKRGVAGGLGIALVPRVTVSEELASGALVELNWRPPFTLFTQIAWRRGKRLPAHVRLFVEQARRLVSEQRG
ncbi:LysR family transcriptional regulator [Streptomyces sp. NBC_01353]|uniref:LysR family transcriptional regulator n=1 Tax=Streptomyces sp. NBC_01353 TaxID=2903835 RepID=UPI002E342B54|nr:LysR family transcriptional regulator [Streptomyces sp. NBC_01353]